MKPMKICILETLSSSVKHEAIKVPNPGSIKLKTAEMTAQVLLTWGTLEIRSHICRSLSPILTNLFFKCDVSLF